MSLLLALAAGATEEVIVPEVVGTGTPANGTGSVSPGLPSGWAIGDLHVLVVNCKRAETLATPSGWILVGNAVPGVDNKVTVFTRKAQFGDSTPTVADPGDHLYAVIVGLRAPYGVTVDAFTATTATTNTAVSWPTVTTTSAGCYILNVMSHGLDSTGAKFSVITGDVTEIFDNSITSNDGGGIVILGSDQSAAGESIAATGTLDSSAVQALMTIAFVAHGPRVIATYLGSQQGDTWPATTITGSIDVGDVNSTKQVVAFVSQMDSGRHAVSGTIGDESFAIDTIEDNSENDGGRQISVLRVSMPTQSGSQAFSITVTPDTGSHVVSFWAINGASTTLVEIDAQVNSTASYISGEIQAVENGLVLAHGNHVGGPYSWQEADYSASYLQDFLACVSGYYSVTSADPAFFYEMGPSLGGNAVNLVGLSFAPIPTGETGELIGTADLTFGSTGTMSSSINFGSRGSRSKKQAVDTTDTITPALPSGSGSGQLIVFASSFTGDTSTFSSDNGLIRTRQYGRIAILEKSVTDLASESAPTITFGSIAIGELITATCLWFPGGTTSRDWVDVVNGGSTSMVPGSLTVSIAGSVGVVFGQQPNDKLDSIFTANGWTEEEYDTTTIGTDATHYIALYDAITAGVQTMPTWSWTGNLGWNTISFAVPPITAGVMTGASTFNFTTTSTGTGIGSLTGTSALSISSSLSTPPSSYSVRFNGSDEGYSRVLTGITPSAFTFCGWAYIVADRGVEEFQPLINAVRDLSNHADAFLAWHEPDVDGFAIGSYKPTGGDFVGGATAPPVGEWFFYYMRSGGAGLQSGWRRPADGSWTVAGCALAGSAQFDTLRINYDTFNNWSDRRQGPFYVYDNALSDAELLSQMGQLAPIEAPWAWYPFNKLVVADNAVDQSGNNRNLTPSGTLTVEEGSPVSDEAPIAGTSSLMFTSTATLYGTANAIKVGWVAQPNIANAIRYDIASSADGTKLVTGTFLGTIHTSVDSGINWTERSGPGSRVWSSFASSADGTKLVAAAQNGYIYTSVDSGVNWTEQTGSGSKQWWSVASNNDGTKLAAVPLSGDYVYTSTDSGVNWTQRTTSGARTWGEITSNADGTKLVAVVQGGYIYTSTDSGVNWIERTGAGSRNWQGVASSTDGTKLVAAAQDNYIWTSIDSGVTWTQRTASGSRGWNKVTSSDDGSRIFAGVNSVFTGFLYSSTDSGVTWNVHLSAGLKNWYGLTSNSDGTKFAAVAFNSTRVYTYEVDDDLTLVTSNATIVAQAALAGTSVLTIESTTTVIGNGVLTSIPSSIGFSSTGSGVAIGALAATPNITLSTNNPTINGFAHGTSAVSISFAVNDTSITGRTTISGSSALDLTTSGNLLWLVNISSKVPGVSTSWTQQTGSGNRPWYDVAGSSDGTNLAAVVYNGYIYTSTDSGVTWTEQTGAGSRIWYAVASSADGTKLVAVAYNNYIYTSTDSGVTWTARTSAGSRTWFSVTSSSDGTKLAATTAVGYIYTSDDSGVTWTQRTSAGSRSWRYISSSADGTKLAAVITGNIYTSDDSGVTWTARTSAGSRSWQGISLSADGTKLVAGVYNGYIYTSTDSGATWTERTSAGSRTWLRTIETSANGSVIVAWADGGYIHTSTDSGATWTQHTSLGAANWIGHFVSYDGFKIVSAKYNESIYTTTLDPETLTFGHISEISAEGSLSGTSALTFDTNLIVYPIWGDTAITFDGTGDIIPVVSASSKIRSFTSLIETTTPNAIWYNICSSEDGTKLAATQYNYVYTSTDSGATWTLNSLESSEITDLICSADGTKIVAVLVAGVHVSDDSGATWTTVELPYSNSGYKGAISDDGTKIVVCGRHDGYIYTSTDSGVIWTVRTSAGSRRWAGIAASSDGTKLVAVVNPGYIYTSTDSGATWTERTSSGYRKWTSVSMTADGSYIAAGGEYDYIATSTDFGSTWENNLEIGVVLATVVQVSRDGNRVLISENTSGNRIHYKESGQWSTFTTTPYGLYDAAFAGQEIFLGRNISSEVYKAGFSTVPQTVLNFASTATIQSSSVTNKPISSAIYKGFYAAYNAQSLYISDDMHMQVYWYGREIFFTYDMGKTWSPVSLSEIPYSVVLWEFNSQIYIKVTYLDISNGYYGTIYKLSVDGLSWELVIQFPGYNFISTSVNLSATRIYTIDSSSLLSIYDLSDGTLLEQFDNVNVTGEVFETPKPHILVINEGIFSKSYSFNKRTGMATQIGDAFSSGFGNARIYGVSKSGQYVVRKEPSFIKLSSDYGLTYSQVVNAQSLYSYAHSGTASGKLDVDDLGNIYVTASNGSVHRFVMNGLTPTARESYMPGSLYNTDAVLSPNKKAFVYRSSTFYGPLYVSKLSQDGTSLISAQSSLSAPDGHANLGLAPEGIMTGVGSLVALLNEDYLEYTDLDPNDLYTVKAPYGPDVFTFSEFTESLAQTPYYNAYDDCIYVSGDNGSYLQKYASNGTFLEAFKLSSGGSATYSKLQFVDSDIVYSQRYYSTAHTGVYVSSNGSPFFPKTEIGNLFEYTVASSNTSIRYALTLNTASRPIVLLKSTDSGVTWSTQYAPGDLVANSYLAVSGDGSVVIIASNSGARISINSGVDWVSIADNFQLVSLSPNAQTVMFVNSNNLYYADVAALYAGGSLTNIGNTGTNFTSFNSISNWLSNTEFLYLNTSNYVSKYTVGGSSTVLIAEGTLSVTIGNNTLITVTSSEYTVKIWDTSGSLLNSFLPTDGLKYVSAYDYDISNGSISTSTNNRLFVETNDYLTGQTVTTISRSNFYYDDLYDAPLDRYVNFFVLDFSFYSGDFFDVYVDSNGGSNNDWYELYSFSANDLEAVTGNQRFTNLKWEIYTGPYDTVNVYTRISENNPIMIGSFGLDESNRVFFRINGVLIAQTDPLPRDATSIGYAYYDTSYPTLEAMFIRNPLDSDIEVLEGYLAHKWGRESALDASHTYKTEAPLGPGTGDPAHNSFEALATGDALAFIEAEESLVFTGAASVNAGVEGVAGSGFTTNATLTGFVYGSGASVISFTNLTTLTGLVQVNAQTGIAFISNGVISGRTTISSIPVSLNLTTSGLLRGQGYFAGTSLVVFNNQGSIKGNTSGIGLSTIGFVVAGVQTGKGSLAGANVPEFTSVGQLRGLTGLTANSTVAFDSLPRLTTYVPIYGSSLVTLATSSIPNISGQATAAGDISTLFDAVGVPSANAEAIGSIELLLHSDGAITGIAEASGSAEILFTATGDSIFNQGITGFILAATGFLSAGMAFVGNAILSFGHKSLLKDRLVPKSTIKTIDLEHSAGLTPMERIIQVAKLNGKNIDIQRLDPSIYVDSTNLPTMDPVYVNLPQDLALEDQLRPGSFVIPSSEEEPTINIPIPPEVPALGPQVDPTDLRNQPRPGSFEEEDENQ